MPIIDSIATGILVSLVYDLAKQSLILFKGDFFDKIEKAYEEALKKSGVENQSIRQQYLRNIGVSLNKISRNENYTLEELATALDCSEDLTFQFLGNFEMVIRSDNLLHNWVLDVYAKETLSELKRIRKDTEFIKQFLIEGEKLIEEFNHIHHIGEIAE